MKTLFNTPWTLKDGDIIDSTGERVLVDYDAAEDNTLVVITAAVNYFATHAEAQVVAAKLDIAEFQKELLKLCQKHEVIFDENTVLKGAVVEPLPDAILANARSKKK